MSRPSVADEYILRVNLKSGTDRRRFCEVHVKGNDVYVFQPRKGKSVKISYHESGQRHLKIGDGPAMFVQELNPLKWIKLEEHVWPKSFENFASLLPYKGQPADDIFDIDLPTASANTITFGQVSVGRFFDPKGWDYCGVTQTTLQQQVFPVAKSPSNLSICVRVLRL